MATMNLGSTYPLLTLEATTKPQSFDPLPPLGSTKVATSLTLRRGPPRTRPELL